MVLGDGSGVDFGGDVYVGASASALQYLRGGLMLRHAPRTRLQDFVTESLHGISPHKSVTEFQHKVHQRFAT